MSDHTGTKILYPALPDAEALIADKGYDSDDFRDALHAKGIEPCIPPKSNWTVSITYDTKRYRHRSKIEIMFGSLKDWRCIDMRYEQCANTFFSTI